MQQILISSGGTWWCWSGPGERGAVCVRAGLRYDAPTARRQPGEVATQLMPVQPVHRRAKAGGHPAARAVLGQQGVVRREHSLGEVDAVRGVLRCDERESVLSPRTPGPATAVCTATTLLGSVGGLIRLTVNWDDTSGDSNK